MSEADRPLDATPGDATPDEDAAPDEERFDELREAAGAVVASLKQLASAAEKVLEDPETFAQLAASGRAVVDAFLGGFGAEPPTPPDPATDEPDRTGEETGGDAAFSG